MFEGIKNIRDLAEAFAGLKPGCLYRTAAPVHATSADAKLLYDDLGIRDLIDLRSSDELYMDGTSPVFEGVSYCRYKRDRAVNRVVPDASSYIHGGSRGNCLRVQIAVMEKTRYYWSLVSRMGKRKALQLAATTLVNKDEGRRMAIEEVNQGGLEMLYRILLEDSPGEWVAALRHIRASAEQGRPVLFFCRAGKDRTGLLATLILTILGATEEQILNDYVRSNDYGMVALAGLEENPKVTGLDKQKFEKAPREAMHYALQYLKEAHGGIQQYLLNAGFSLDEQAELRALLLQAEQQKHPDPDAPLFDTSSKGKL
eukprot:GHRR01007624.1.p1 GENE.GHRR01007624.1~~GHRR01007624.1.p1  ORF type:complete len:314 (+),score=78.04 GHRR01007624.1:841-1782(+)